MLRSGMIGLFLALAHTATVPKPIPLTPMITNLVPNATAMQSVNAKGPSPLNGHFSYHIPETTITLYYKDTGDRLPLGDIHVCLRNLRRDIIQEISSHGASAPSTKKHFRHKSVYLGFTPRSMTWMVAAEVIDALGAIVSNDRWTYASHVRVYDANEGTVGYLSIAYRAPGLAPSTPRLASERSSSRPTGNSTRGNTTLTFPRPSSPYPYVIPGSPISVIFSHYRRALHADTVFNVLLAAQIFVVDKLSEHGPLAPVGQLEPWRLRNVVLEVVARSRMRWWDLAGALDGVTDFVSTFGAFAFSFEVRYEGYRELGVGQLRAEARGVGR